MKDAHYLKTRSGVTTCACGMQGTHAAVQRHVDEKIVMSFWADMFSSDEAHPACAPSSFVETDPTPAPLPPTPSVAPKISCPLCPQGTPVQDLPEITSWSCGHEILKRPRSIAASFQDMLRSSYQAGVASAATGKTFEAWYQREVLQ